MPWTLDTLDKSNKNNWIIDFLISHPSTSSPVPDVEPSEKILTQFVKKVENIRFQIQLERLSIPHVNDVDFYPVSTISLSVRKHSLPYEPWVGILLVLFQTVSSMPLLTKIKANLEFK